MVYACAKASKDQGKISVLKVWTVGDRRNREHEIVKLWVSMVLQFPLSVSFKFYSSLAPNSPASDNSAPLI